MSLAILYKTFLIHYYHNLVSFFMLLPRIQPLFIYLFLRNEHVDLRSPLYGTPAGIFLVRDSMLSALYAISNPSVCLSVRPSVKRVDQWKTVEVRIMQFSPYSFLWDKFHPEILAGSLRAGPRGRQTRVRWGNELFSKF